ncbi:MAG: hypothetical protein A2046_05935 [Bacteroidetes bacterium GWA2_30_7]|nr:MAG: hypothetical protein A2046_05935 [Bacteroidetes bacterium GWA2_30_7]
MKIKFLKAFKGDSILISFTDDKNNPKNILIDGGMAGTYYNSTSNQFGNLKTEVDNIRSKNENIDLLVLTHIDNDHICGLLKWFEMDKEAHKLVKNVWFNSGKLIAEYLKKPENNDLSVGLDLFKTTFTGVKDAIDFENYLLAKEIWNRKIIKLGNVYKSDNIQMLVLSPTRNQLKNLLKEYKEKTGNIAYTAAGGKDWNIDLKAFIEEENDIKFKFAQDTSVKNGSSISFILTIKEKNFLFLGDSHPKEIVSYLKKKGFSKEKPLNVELMKLSHHGSKGNTNKELLELVKIENYIISTDSSEHGHPNKRTLARIISINPNAVFHFNYEFVKDNIFNDKDFEDYTNFSIKLTNELDFAL